MVKQTQCRANNPQLCPYHGVQILKNKIETFYSNQNEKKLHFGEDFYYPDRPYRNIVRNFKKKLSPEELENINLYFGEQHRVINKWLRSSNNLNHFPLYHKKCVQTLDQIFEQQITPESETRTLYRGVRYFPNLDKIKVGKVFEDKAFTSTTSNPKVCPIFTNVRTPIIFKITTKNGLPLSNDVFEEEFLLPRNSKFLVTKIEKNVNLSGDEEENIFLNHAKVYHLQTV